MWIALFDFCLFLLLVAFFFYGLSAWDRLLADPSEEEEEEQPERARGVRGNIGNPPGRFWAIWALILGCGLISLSSDLLSWLAG